jgi:hypothetical protein
MKVFTDNTILKKDLRKQICLMSKTLNVQKVVFNNKSKDLAGTYNAKKHTIFIDSKQNKKDMLLTYFHELGHHIAVSKGKWLLYHYSPGTPLITSRAKFKIENNIDKIARQLWNKYVDTKVWGKYKYGYPQTSMKKTINWFNSFSNT